MWPAFVNFDAGLNRNLRGTGMTAFHSDYSSNSARRFQNQPKELPTTYLHTADIGVAACCGIAEDESRWLFAVGQPFMQER